MTKKEAVECLKLIAHKEAANHNRQETMALRKAIRYLRYDPLRKAGHIILVAIAIMTAYLVGIYI